MGVNTRLLIDSKWEVEDIMELIQSYLTLTQEPTFKHWGHAPGKGTITFNMKGDNKKQVRSLTFYPQYSSPLGTCTMLSMGTKFDPRKNESWAILRTIGKVLGGFFNPQDNNDVWEEYPGLFYDQDGFAYHFKHAVLNKGLLIDERGEHGEYSILHLDVAGLTKSIEEWERKHRRNDRGTLLIKE